MSFGAENQLSVITVRKKWWWDTGGERVNKTTVSEPRELFCSTLCLNQESNLLTYCSEIVTVCILTGSRPGEIEISSDSLAVKSAFRISPGTGCSDSNRLGLGSIPRTLHGLYQWIVITGWWIDHNKNMLNLCSSVSTLSSRHTESEFFPVKFFQNSVWIRTLITSTFLDFQSLSFHLSCRAFWIQVFGPDKDIEEKKAEALWYLVLITWLN